MELCYDEEEKAYFSQKKTECEEILINFISENKEYDLSFSKFMTALIFLNIA